MLSTFSVLFHVHDIPPGGSTASTARTGAEQAFAHAMHPRRETTTLHPGLSEPGVTTWSLVLC